MNALFRTMIWLALLLSASTFAAEVGSGSGKRIDVDPVDVPEKIVIEPTPEEIHNDNMNTRTCGSCHTRSDLSQKAAPMPLQHFLTTKDCGACHFSKTWVPLRRYSHLSGKYTRPADGAEDDCLSCHDSNTEFRARLAPRP